MNTQNSKTSYDVGFGKPPKSSRFKKGQSGNPAGKKKGTKNLKTDLEEELKGQIEIGEGSRKRKITKQRGLIMALLAKALKGDVRASNTVLKLLADTIGFDVQSKEAKGVSMEDQEILDLFLELNGYERSAEAVHAIPDQVEIDPSVQWMFDE